MFVDVIFSKIDPKEERYGKNTMSSICKKNLDQETQCDEAKKS